jgi:Zn finger protein HypA/HybF involved in hydrogenase expression
MKTLITTVAAGLLAVSFAVTANATTKSEARQHMAQREAACKEQAAKKVSAIHFLKRRQLVNECMGRTAQAKVAKTHHVKAVKIEKKAQPTTTGQSVK